MILTGELGSDDEPVLMACTPSRVMEPTPSNAERMFFVVNAMLQISNEQPTALWCSAKKR